MNKIKIIEDNVMSFEQWHNGCSQEVIDEKAALCLGRMRQNWTAILEERGYTITEPSVPTYAPAPNAADYDIKLNPADYATEQEFWQATITQNQTNQQNYSQAVNTVKLQNKVLQDAYLEAKVIADTEFSELVFAQPDYKNRAEREEKNAEQILNEAKEAKIQTLKSNRDNANLRPMVSIKAPELIGEMGSKTFGDLVYFSFDTKATNNPATEPNSIVFATILNGMVNPNYYAQYSTIIIEGDSTRKGYVAITPTVAGQLAGHAAHRNTMNIEYCNQQEVLIKAVSVYFPEGHEQAGQLDINSSLEALNQINITY